MWIDLGVQILEDFVEAASLAQPRHHEPPPLWRADKVMRWKETRAWERDDKRQLRKLRKAAVIEPLGEEHVASCIRCRQAITRRPGCSRNAVHVCPKVS